MSNSNAEIKSGKLWTETLVNYPLKSVVNYGVKYPVRVLQKYLKMLL